MEKNKCVSETFFELIEFLQKDANYQERAKTVYSGDYLTLKIPDPVDFVYSKLMRGTEDLIEREKLIQFPKDPETLLFKKKFQHLMELIATSRK